MPPVSGLVKALKHIWNGSEWKPAFGGREFEALASASRTSDTNSADFQNTDAQNAYIIWDITANTGAINISFAIRVKDPSSGNYLAIGGSGARTAKETKCMAYGPAAKTAVGDVISVKDVPLGATMRVEVIHNNSNPVTYSVGVVLI